MRSAHCGVTETYGGGVMRLPGVGAHLTGQVDGGGIEVGDVRRSHRTFSEPWSAVGPLCRNTLIRSFSAVAFLDFLMARFSLMDLPDFLLGDCRGDLSDMTLPGCLGRYRYTSTER
jgi:hypothetical protein